MATRPTAGPESIHLPPGQPLDEPTATPRKNITVILVEAGVVTADQVDVALARQRETGRRIGESLVELGFVSEEDIGWALARQLGIPFVDVRADTLDAELLRSFPDGALRRLHAVPLFRSEGRVTAAVADPTDRDAIQEFERLCDAPASCVAATPSAIEQALDEILGRRHGARARAADAPAEPYEVIWDRSGETFLNFHLKHARRLGTPEIHFACADGWLHIRHRAATRLSTLGREPAAVMDVLLARFESLGMTPLSEGGGHREFTATLDVAGATQAVRVSLLATPEGASATVRLLRTPGEAARLETLGLEPLDVAQLREQLSLPSGLVLVCGPDDAGCTATLAALLAECATDDRHWAVCTREAALWPPSSGSVDVVSGPAAARWRRIAVAHALDGVVVDGGLGGHRVREVTSGATHGRWLLARTDWPDSFALLEWLGRSPEGRLTLARRLRAVIQQRWVATPRANAARTQSEDLDPRAVHDVDPPGEPAERLQRLVFEVLFPSDALRDGLRTGAGADALRTLALSEGFHPLSDHLKAGVQRGRLDPRDAERAVA